jgi:hypothetical protein
MFGREGSSLLQTIAELLSRRDKKTDISQSQTEISQSKTEISQSARVGRSADRYRASNSALEVVYVEGWRAGVDHPHLAPINRRLDRLLCVGAPMAQLQAQQHESVMRDLSELEALKQGFFADRRWVLNAEPGLGDGTLRRGRLEWERSPKLMIFEMAMQVDSNNHVSPLKIPYNA